MPDKSWTLPGMSQESEDVERYLNRLESFTNAALEETESSYKEEAPEDRKKLESYKATYFRETGSRSSALGKSRLRNEIDSWVKKDSEVTSTGYVEDFIFETREVLEILDKYLGE